jgi:hypothetical protein
MGFGGKIKRNQADKHFSDCIRKSQNWSCQRCGKNYEDKPAGLQCSHFITRGNWAVRYDTSLSLCAYCHNWVEGNPPEHIKLFTAHIGGERELEKFIERSECKGLAQHNRANVKALSAYYKAESERLSEELQKAKEGKQHDLKLYRYIRR